MKFYLSGVEEMKIGKFILLSALFLVGCGVDDAQTKSLTDMKSVLLYQHVEADRFRLLACPYAVDLDIARDCSNVFFTPDGDEYHFTGIPKQPWLFAPSQAAVKGLLTVPIVVGGAVLSWVVLRKLLTKLNLDATKKQLINDALPAKSTDDVAQAAGKQAAKQFDELTQKSYRELADELEKINKSYAEKFKDKEKILRSKNPSNALEQQKTKKFADILVELKADKQFMDEQFKLIEEAIGESQVYQRLGFSWFSRPSQPGNIFKKFKNAYSKEINRMHKSFSEDGVLKFEEGNTVIKNMQAMNDDLIENEAEFLSRFMQLVERADVLDTMRANRRSFRKETVAAQKEELEEHAKAIVTMKDTSARQAGSIRDFLIAALGGLLAGSYLPDKLPQLENHLFTEREWKKLFARDDNFKKPLRVTDSYAVVKKLTRYLKRKGEKVIINEQVFFGLKN